MNPKHCPWLPLGSSLAAWTDRGLDNEFSAYWLECPVQGGLRSGIGPHTRIIKRSHGVLVIRLDLFSWSLPLSSAGGKLFVKEARHLRLRGSG